MKDQILERSGREYFYTLLDRIAVSEWLMFVYILVSSKGDLYIGVTNHLSQRIFEHKQKINAGFTSKKNCSKLVYFELFNDPGEAIDREKQLKGWRREKKKRLVRTLNPGWIDLSQFLPSIEISRLSETIPRLPSVARED